MRNGVVKEMMRGYIDKGARKWKLVESDIKRC